VDHLVGVAREDRSVEEDRAVDYRRFVGLVDVEDRFIDQYRSVDLDHSVGRVAGANRAADLPVPDRFVEEDRSVDPAHIVDLVVVLVAALVDV
jgi:hypothetical protein